ncbi:MAG: hypothetical protein U0W40_12055 [Acidimicrobiia bacterium]
MDDRAKLFVVVGAACPPTTGSWSGCPPAETAPCSPEAPCTAPWFEKLGFVTLAWMALSGFLLIGTLMVCQIVGNRVAATPGATDEDDDERDEREMETVS